MPSVFAVAFSCVSVSAVPYVMPAGIGQVIVGVAFATSIDTVFVAFVKFALSVGVKVTESVWAAPAESTAPRPGV